MTASNSSDRRELIVVTGASTGMGAATARELARRGFHVLAGVRRDIDADALRGDGIEPHILDITVESDVAAIAERVENDPQRLPLRALINNAGIAINAPVEALPIAEWRRQFEVNLFGHIAMIQALMPSLLRSSGTVVNISSIGGKVALPTYPAYAGSKFALEALSDSLRREVSGLGSQRRRHRAGCGQDRDGRTGSGHRGSAERRHDRRSARPLWRSHRRHVEPGEIVRQGRRFRRTRREGDREGCDRVPSAHAVHHRA